MIETNIIIADTHRPIHDVQAYETTMLFAEEIKPKKQVNIGDIGHFAGISHWNTNRYKMRANYPVIRDFLEVNAHLTWQRQLSPNSEIYYLEGNHEYWINDYLEAHPELEGLMDIDRDLGIAKNKVIRVSYQNQPLQIGKIRFIHGWYTNKYHAFKHSQNIHHNVVYGHAHDMQSFTPNNIEPSQRFMAWSIGHLSDESKADYLRFRPTNWMLGFGIFYLDSETGDFTLVPIAITNGQFFWNGKRYKA